MPVLTSSFHGPPPLARGERHHRAGDLRPVRTTPARAGRTGTWSRNRSTPTDHPRSRGENAGSATETQGIFGPPPLARGELLQEMPTQSFMRTTPARAGRTGDRDLAQFLQWTTPARAGRTTATAAPKPTAADHPRSRGENCPYRSHISAWGGPPPLARGERDIKDEANEPRRTTPARAGRTLRDLQLCGAVIVLRCGSELPSAGHEASLRYDRGDALAGRLFAAGVPECPGGGWFAGHVMEAAEVPSPSTWSSSLARLPRSLSHSQPLKSRSNRLPIRVDWEATRRWACWSPGLTQGTMERKQLDIT